MTQYLIFPTEQEALDRSQAAHTTDTVAKMRDVSGMSERASRNAIAEFVTKYRWATSVGEDGQTAIVIDGDEQLLTAAEQAALVSTLPEDNWPPPEPPQLPATEPPVNQDVPHAYQEGSLLICTMGNWVDPPPDSYEFQWQVDGTEIEGATTDELAVTAGDVDTVFACVVTATNAIGSTWIASNDVMVDADALA